MSVTLVVLLAMTADAATPAAYGTYLEVDGRLINPYQGTRELELIDWSLLSPPAPYTLKGGEITTLRPKIVHYLRPTNTMFIHHPGCGYSKVLFVHQVGQYRPLINGWMATGSGVVDRMGVFAEHRDIWKDEVKADTKQVSGGYLVTCTLAADVKLRPGVWIFNPPNFRALWFLLFVRMPEYSRKCWDLDVGADRDPRSPV